MNLSLTAIVEILNANLTTTGVLIDKPSIDKAAGDILEAALAQQAHTCEPLMRTSREPCPACLAQQAQPDYAASFDFYETNDAWAPGGSDHHYFIRYGTNLAAMTEVPVEIWEAFRDALAQQAQPEPLCGNTGDHSGHYHPGALTGDWCSGTPTPCAGVEHDPDKKCAKCAPQR